MDAFSGKERNLRAEGHSPVTDIKAETANFLPIFPLDDDGSRDRATKIASSFSQDEPICRLEGLADRLRRKRSLEDKLRFRVES